MTMFELCWYVMRLNIAAFLLILSPIISSYSVAQQSVTDNSISIKEVEKKVDKSHESVVELQSLSLDLSLKFIQIESKIKHANLFKTADSQFKKTWLGYRTSRTKVIR